VRLSSILAGALLCLSLPALADDKLRFSLIRTASTKPVPQAMVTASGSWFSGDPSNHVAVLVEHGQQRFLFDTGLGKQAEQQFKQDMPYWIRPVMDFQLGKPARQQLDEAGIEIQQIYLSHTHWDHLSGAPDFPEAKVYAQAEEQLYMRMDSPPRVLPSQINAPIRWHQLPLPEKAYGPFQRSLDLYGDGKVVLVAIPGHTPGSMGMYLNFSPERRYLFVGDAIWRVREVTDHSYKAWPARSIVDHDCKQTREGIEMIRQAQAQAPGLTLIPAHDTGVHDALGYFPNWIE
jgi:glyoxylase-like metal-dependent hydrolase (beta-lactamase superfamily II)